MLLLLWGFCLAVSLVFIVVLIWFYFWTANEVFIPHKKIPVEKQSGTERQKDFFDHDTTKSEYFIECNLLVLTLHTQTVLGIHS